MSTDSSIDPGRCWGGVYPILGPKLPAIAKRLEASGRYGILAGQSWGPPWIPLAAAAAVTERVQLACSVAIAGARSPFETAHAALDLDRISNGRFVLGLGASTRWVTRSHFGVDWPKPVQQLRECVEAVRHVVAHAHTGLTPFEGEYFRADFAGLEPAAPPVRSAIPIWLGALRSRMTRLAGEIADGVIGHPLWGVDYWLGRVQADLAEGARVSGRRVEDLHQCVYLTVAIADDPREAFADARQSVAAYAAIEQYAPFFEDAGFGDAAARIRRLWAADQRELAASEVDEAMARAFVIFGDAEHARREVARVANIATTWSLSPPSWGVPLQRTGFYTAQIDRAFFGRI
ncbi:MAG: LLM class flavin-dependent oxidoreductase [Deltaproteobacteria bacterium]|nr:LLM class flavin-dependent oxidoreductase [Deltaproteobacteria bacterium]